MLTKCCLFEGEIVPSPDQVVVPWGATLAQISEALTVIANAWEPSWLPPDRLPPVRPPVGNR